MQRVRYAVLIPILILILWHSACFRDVPLKPRDTTLEFWLAENVEGLDFSEFHYIGGWGCTGYIPLKYYDGENINDFLAMEDQIYVKYTVTAYPDYSDGGAYITDIVIRDPEISLYGLTLHSSFEDFRRVFSSMGYAIEEHETCIHARKGSISFSLGSGQLRADITVMNREGIMF